MTIREMTSTKPASERSLIASDASPTPWTEARARLEQGDTYWLATVRPDGRPHVVPVLAVWVDNALHFAAGADSRKARNLAWNAHCVVTLRSNMYDLVVEGTARIVRDECRLQRVAEAYASKYGWHVTVRDDAFHDAEGAPTAGPPPYEVYEIVPATAFALGTNEETIHRATRWRF